MYNIVKSTDSGGHSCAKGGYRMADLIIDTDLGCDCDDAAALAVAHKLSDSGECVIRGVTHCTSELSGVNAIYAINRFYGREDIPLGIYGPDGLLDSLPEKYSRQVEERFGRRFESKNECEDAVRLLRRAYAEASAPITLTGVGPLAVISSFLLSGADDISDKSGVQLVRENGGDLVQMACRFDVPSAEWNVEQDIGAARTVFEHWPGKLYVVPFETGENILTGKTLFERNTDDPVTLSYKVYLKGKAECRSSWDPCAVLFAVMRERRLWNVSRPGKISIDRYGVSTFTEGGGQHFTVSAAKPDEVQREIERLIALMPD